MLKKSTSPAAFSKNVKTEMAAGRPQKQAVAIAYATKRKATAEQHSGMSRTGAKSAKHGKVDEQY